MIQKQGAKTRRISKGGNGVPQRPKAVSASFVKSVETESAQGACLAWQRPGIRLRASRDCPMGKGWWRAYWLCLWGQWSWCEAPWAPCPGQAPSSCDSASSTVKMAAGPPSQVVVLRAPRRRAWCACGQPCRAPWERRLRRDLWARRGEIWACGGRWCWKGAYDLKGGAGTMKSGCVALRAVLVLAHPPTPFFPSSPPPSSPSPPFPIS